MRNLYRLLIGFGALTLLVGTKLSYADWDGDHHFGHHGEHHYYRYHDHPHFGFHVTAFYPEDYYPIWVGGGRYYYDDGIYYSYVGGDYVVVTPPMGAVVSAIPSDFRPVIINGVTYYTDNGTYYIYTPHGYKVVLPPVAGGPIAVGTQTTFAVNVPNNTGGYVTVVLKRSGNGFVGPQGEFYTDFPRISQLRMMYGR